MLHITLLTGVHCSGTNKFNMPNVNTKDRSYTVKELIVEAVMS